MESPSDKRAKLISVVAIVEYSDGSQKEVIIDPNEDEALFWSERAVNEILAPFYENYRPAEESDLNSLSEEMGRKIEQVTPGLVREMWESVADENTGDRPILIKKRRRCIPTIPCKRWCN